MTVKVVDASAIAAICFAEPERLNVVAALTDADLVAPALIDFELANICWKRSRRNPEAADQYRGQLQTRKLLRIQVAPVVFDEVVSLAVATRLTGYDASYLWLARHLGAELVTLDRRLARVAASDA